MSKKPTFLTVIYFLAVVMITSCSSNSNTEIETSPAQSRESVSPKAISSATPLSSPSKSVNSEAILHVDNVKKLPVAIQQDDFYDIEDAIDRNEDAKALIMIRKGKVFMIENDSEVTIIEPFGYLTKIKVKRSGRIGWVKSSWLQ